MGEKRKDPGKKDANPLPHKNFIRILPEGERPF